MSTRKYLQAIQREPMKVPPVWLMRQAGRYLPEYMQVRNQTSFLDLCNTPELACEVTLQPIRRFHFDASILFSDILIPLVPMGADLSFSKGHGPAIANPIRHADDVRKMKGVDPASDLSQVLKTVTMLRRELPDDVALIGFAGAPFTLSTYWIEGEKPDPFANVKRMMYRDPALYQELLQKLGKMVTDYLIAQYEAGADAVQVFDTWAGILPAHEFRAVNLSVLKSIFSELKRHNIPATYYAKDSSHLIEVIAELECDVIGLDWRMPLDKARKVIGRNRTLQGNLDPTVLFGDESVIRREVRRVLSEAGTDGGHIFNLGHGILPATPIESVEVMLDEIRRGEG